MRRLILVGSMVAISSIPFIAGPAHASCTEDPPNAPCPDAVTSAQCVVDTVANYQGPIKNLPTEIRKCYLRP